jgi:peptidoglycan/xylan/chitin deacetylase (PgdA/CDA1 family)
LHNFYDWLFTLVTGISGRPVPYLGLWPEGRSWAFVLTHDVETVAGYREMELLRGPERERGYRSSWNFVGLRYTVYNDTLSALAADGCEVGVHGLRHDGRDLASRRLMEKRLPEMREYAKRWQAVGFRSPATQRQWELMPHLGFDYDSSYSDSDPYEPQPGGCCSYLPYFNQAMVELPITLPQDHTLFTILQHSDAELWLRKAEHIRERRGMVLVLTHPDYAHDPRLAAGYRQLLDAFASDGSVWHALPRDVAAWWRRRGASTLCRNNGSWSVAGPASGDGRVRFTSPGRVSATW